MGAYYDNDCDAETPEVFHREIVAKSKLNHRCTECNGIVEKGQSYERSSGVWDGRWSTYRKCEKCMAFESAMEVHCRGFLGGNPFGYMYENIRETMENVYSDVNPGRWFFVARRLVAVRRNYEDQIKRNVVDKSGRGNPRRQLFWQRIKHVRIIRQLKAEGDVLQLQTALENP